jgi:Putative lactococcus lactis phage r1t holin
MIWSVAFWKATAERVISTAAQAALAVLGVKMIANGVTGAAAGIFDIDWGNVAAVSALAAVAALLKALAAAKQSGNGPGFGQAEVLTPTVAAVEAPADVPAEFVAGPAADVPEGEPVHVVRDVDSVAGAIHDEVADALNQPYSGDSKTDATYHGKHDAD